MPAELSDNCRITITVHSLDEQDHVLDCLISQDIKKNLSVKQLDELAKHMSVFLNTLDEYILED